MRIVVCNWKDAAHPQAGGAEVFVQHVTERWARSHEVRLLTSEVAGRAPRETVGGVRIERSGGRFGVYRHVRRALAEEAGAWADVILDSINTRPFLTTRRARRLPAVGLPYQVCREIWFDEMPLPVALAGRYVLEPYWLRTYRDRPVVTISASSAASLQDYGIPAPDIVPVGTTWIDPGPIVKEPTPTLAFLGRLSPNKGAGDAIEAFAHLRKDLDATLWVIGDGPSREALERSAPPGVIFHGRVDERRKFELLGRAHLLLVASRREGWGLVVTEAAAVGTRSVCYDVPGLRDSAAAAGGCLSAAEPAALAAAAAGALNMEPLGRIEPPSWDAAAAALLVHLERAARLVRR